MNTNIEHLPEEKKDELNQIVSVIRKKCDDVEMIVLFGSYARGDYKIKADLKPDRKSGHISDYDILVVTKKRSIAENTGLWEIVTKTCNTSAFSAHARIIVHDIQELNIKLAEGQYFFSDIKKEGYILFSSGTSTLADKREVTPEEKQRIAQDHFDHWFNRAEDFIFGFDTYIKAEKYKIAAFNLHQTVEACYKTVMLVFTNYNPNEHYLSLLGNWASEEDSSFEGIIPREKEEDRDRFNLLDYAYIGSRYDPKYRISKSDLDILAISVKKLLELTNKVCLQKINNFKEQR